MTGPAYYNDIDPHAAAWLRNLIAAGHIAPGDVDERSIVDVRADDLRGYAQCHFFAGIGGWSLALRLAGWPDDRPVWTGSCPCQPFSAAGKRGGFDDERHLWPVFHDLIRQCRPAVVMGEQVASKDGLTWLDAVHADFQASGYAAGAVDWCAAGVGAPHIRQRLWWIGERLDDTAGARHVGALDRPEGEARDEARLRLSGAGSGPCRLAHHHHHGREGIADAGLRRAELHDADGRGADGGLADANGGQSRQVGAGRLQPRGEYRQHERVRAGAGSGVGSGHNAPRSYAVQNGDENTARSDGRLVRPGPTNGQWRDADWLFCRDGKWRPVEPGTFPLAHGIPNRVGRLRAYGNAIVPQVAAEVIGAYLDAECFDSLLG